MELDFLILPKQRQILQSAKLRIVCTAGRGAGKSYTAALVALNKCLEGKNGIIVEPTYAQLKEVFFRELEGICIEKNLPYTYNKSRPSLKIGYGSGGEVLGISGDQPDRLRGPTNKSFLILDECSTLDEACLTLGVPTLRGKAVRSPQIYMFSTPGGTGHWMSKIALSGKDDVEWVKSSFKDNHFNGKDYVDMLLSTYENLPEDFIQRELYGEIVDIGADSLFDIIKTDAPPSLGDWRIGLDIAGAGADWTAAVVLRGNEITHAEKTKTNDEYALKRFVRSLSDAHIPDGETATLRYDETGIGALVRFEVPKIGKIIPVSFGAGAGGRYADMRALIYFQAREMLKSGICISLKDPRKWDQIKNELLHVKLDDRETAKIRLIKKAEIKKTLGHSPDLGDAFALACMPVKQSIDFDRIAAEANPFRRQA
jgi:hypothetical protein